MEEIPLENTLEEESVKYDHLIEKSPLEEEEEEKEKKSLTLKERAQQVLDACGWRFLIFLVFSQFGCKGLLLITIKNVMLPLFRNQLDAATLQIYLLVVMMPWTIKPIIGLCSDYILIGGYHKRGWLVFSVLVGLTSSVLLFVAHNPFLLVLCFAGINFEVALYDLLSEGKYAEIRKNNDRLGSDLTTFTQALQMAGLLVGTSFVGFLSDAQLYKIMYLLILTFSVLPLIPTLLGWLPEDYHPLENSNVGCANVKKVIRLVDLDDIHQNWKIILVVFISGLAGLTVSFTTSILSEPINMFVGFGVGMFFLFVILIGSHYAFKPHPLITSVALYQVITSIGAPLIGSELDYFYTATPECLADGPHFSYAYYISYTGVVGTLVGLSGTFVYHILLSKLKFRPVLLITTLLVSLAGLSDLMIVQRWNVAWGIPDRVAYMVGEAILEPLLGILNWIPVSALIALAAPKGMEASCFAFLAGVSNFSRMMSELSGSMLIHFTQNGEACDFSSLWWLVLLCHVSFPLVVGVMAVWLVPDMEQNEKV